MVAVGATLGAVALFLFGQAIWCTIFCNNPNARVPQSDLRNTSSTGATKLTSRYEYTSTGGRTVSRMEKSYKFILIILFRLK